MSKTLSATYANGYTLTGTSEGVLDPVSVTGSIAIGSGLIPAALYAQGPDSWTVTNQGSITGGAVAGIVLAAGGTVVNNQAGFLGGHFGVAIQGGPGSVTNSGTILAANAGTSATAYQAIGVLLSAGGGVLNQISSQITGRGAGVDILGGTGTVVNAGTISGPAYDGVYLANGSVTNMSGAVIKGGTISGGGSIGAGGSVVTSGWGVVIQNGGSLYNAGLVTDAGQGGAFLGGGGGATNLGTISGAWGIANSGAPGTVTNAGYLDGTLQSGVFLIGGTVTNAPLGRIVGVSGIVIRGAAGTVANSGFIEATSPAGYAIYLANGFANRVVDNPGARFSGLVNGGNAVGEGAVSTLELGVGSQAGTLSGLATQFINFQQVTVDAGAFWSMTGANTVAAGATLSNQGNLALNGALRMNGTLTSAQAMTVASGGGIVASATVGVSGASWNLASELVVGALGSGSVTISNAASVVAETAGLLPAMALGAGSGGAGSLLVTGTGSRATLLGQLNVGQAGAGSLLVENAASVSTGTSASADPYEGFDIAQLAGGSGNATVTGSHSALFNTGRFLVGDAGVGSLAILAGGTITTTPGTGAGAPPGAVIANTAAASGSFADVSGTGSNWQVTGLLDVGAGGSGALLLSSGATVTAGALDAGNAAAAVGQISLSDAGTELLVTNAATVADDGTGVLSVLAGATFAASSLTIGAQGDSSGALVVSGSGSVVQLSGALNVGTSLGTGDLTVGPGAAVHASVVNLQGQVVLEGGLLDPTVQLINQGQTASGFGTIAAGDIVDKGVIQAGGTKPSQKLLLVEGTVLGGGTLTVNGTLPGSSSAGILQINAGGTMELTGAVLNAATTTFTDELTPTGTYTVNNSVVDVSFADAAGVLKLDDIAGFAGTITTWQTGDSFVVTGGTLSGLNVSNNNTLTVSDSGTGAAAGGIDQIIFGSAVSAAGFAIVNSNTIQVACFAEGTRIQTATGLVAVELLAVGDHVVTTDGHGEIATAAGPVLVEALTAGDREVTTDARCAPIVWIGQRTVDCARHPRPETVWPVRVRAGAFGANVPVRDLYLSPDHAVLVNGVLVPVKLLINRASIAQVKADRVRYFHVELPRHAVIEAEGLPVESYLDTGDRTNFRQDGEAMRLFPDFAERLSGDLALLWETRGAAPLVMTGPELEAARKVVRDNARRRSRPVAAVARAG
jgi:T5SS/PEP-CTERM-associated repeat protein